MPVMASRNSDRVGVKMNFGGQVSAADSGLNAVITIHSTGMKNMIAAAQARMAQPTRPDHSRRPPRGERRAAEAVRGERRAVKAVIVPPRTGRPGRTSAAQTWRR